MTLGLSPGEEMRVYCRYFTGSEADEGSVNSFERGVVQKCIPLNEKEERALRFLIRNAWSIGCIDAALGLFHPPCNLRRRFVLAYAILETNPVYFDFFCPRRYPVFYPAVLAAKAAGEAIKGIVGSFILLLV